MNKEFICKFCGKILKRSCALAIHERTCKFNPNRKPLENHICGFAMHKLKQIEEIFICQYCGKKSYKKNLHLNHERCCFKNPNRVYVNGISGKKPWNYGKTKETDERIKKSANTLISKYESGEIKKPFLGKHHSEKNKKILSEKRKQYLLEHPDKVPYKVYHHSKGDSYPEKYFKEILIKNNIDFKQNFYVCGYFLDFAIVDKHLYFEVDGEQHYNDKRIVEHDKIRTKVLNDNGWNCILRIRWSDYVKLNKVDKIEYIKNLLKLLGH